MKPVVALLLALGAQASWAPAASARASEPEANSHDLAAEKHTASRILLEKMGRGDFSRLGEIYGPGFVAHAGQRTFTLDQDNDSARRLLALYPGMTVSVDRIVAEGDLVALHWRAKGVYRDPATASARAPGKPMTVDGMSFFRLANGRVVEEWSVSDELGLMRQMGAAPNSGGPASR